MTTSNDLDATTLVLLVLGALVILPLLMMLVGFSGMMGAGGMTSGGWMMDGTTHTGGWWPIVGLFVPLVFLVVLVGGGYLAVRNLTQTASSADPAMEELRMAYARGDLTDEEFEARRERLEHEEK